MKLLNTVNIISNRMPYKGMSFSVGGHQVFSQNGFFHQKFDVVSAVYQEFGEEVSRETKTSKIIVELEKI